jgi:hypothetical protein
MDVLFFLILAHFCGDYAFQSDYLAEKKKSSNLLLFYHVLIYTVCLWAFIALFSLIYQRGLYLESSFLLFMAILFAEHWLQDFLKGKTDRNSRQLYYIDQVLHIVMLYIYRIFIYKS